MFKINPKAQMRVEVVGNDKTPVIIIDDFGEDLQALKNIAYEATDFDKDKETLYPGLRKSAPPEYTQAIIRDIARAVFEVYQLPLQLKLSARRSFYSLVSYPPEELSIPQRIPHFDTNYHYHFAMVHYISEREHGGTGIYRHKPTGYEIVTQSRVQSYFQHAKQHMEKNGLPEADYITGTTDQYELVYELDYVPNRLVLYPGPILHSGLIRPDIDIDPNPKTGRLTVNTFFEFH